MSNEVMNNEVVIIAHLKSDTGTRPETVYLDEKGEWGSRETRCVLTRKQAILVLAIVLKFDTTVTTASMYANAEV